MTFIYAQRSLMQLVRMPNKTSNVRRAVCFPATADILKTQKAQDSNSNIMNSAKMVVKKSM